MINTINFFIKKVINGLAFSITINLGIIQKIIQSHDVLVQICNAWIAIA
jgi:hypothetical protein